MNIDFWNLLYNHLEECHHNNVYQNVMQDADYLKFTQQEQEFCSQYESLNLSDDQRKVILNWIDTINAQNEAYTIQRLSSVWRCSVVLHCFWNWQI